MRLVLLRLLRRDDGVEVALEREDGKGQIDRLPTLGGDDAELTAFGPQSIEHTLDALEGDEVVVERLVVLAVDADELFCTLLVERRASARRCSSRPQPLPATSSGISRASTVCVACLNEARMISPESISVPSRSKRTVG